MAHLLVPEGGDCGDRSPEIDQRHPMTLPADLYANNLVSIACNIASTVYSAR